MEAAPGAVFEMVQTQPAQMFLAVPRVLAATAGALPVAFVKVVAESA